MAPKSRRARAEETGRKGAPNTVKPGERPDEVRGATTAKDVEAVLGRRLDMAIEYSEAMDLLKDAEENGTEADVSEAKAMVGEVVSRALATDTAGTPYAGGLPGNKAIVEEILNRTRGAQRRYLGKRVTDQALDEAAVEAKKAVLSNFMNKSGGSLTDQDIKMMSEYAGLDAKQIEEMAAEGPTLRLAHLMDKLLPAGNQWDARGNAVLGPLATVLPGESAPEVAAPRLVDMNGNVLVSSGAPEADAQRQFGNWLDFSAAKQGYPGYPTYIDMKVPRFFSHEFSDSDKLYPTYDAYKRAVTDLDERIKQFNFEMLGLDRNPGNWLIEPADVRGGQKTAFGNIPGADMYAFAQMLSDINLKDYPGFPLHRPWNTRIGDWLGMDWLVTHVSPFGNSGNWAGPRAAMTQDLVYPGSFYGVGAREVNGLRPYFRFSNHWNFVKGANGAQVSYDPRIHNYSTRLPYGPLVTNPPSFANVWGLDLSGKLGAPRGTPMQGWIDGGEFPGLPIRFDVDTPAETVSSAPFYMGIGFGESPRAIRGQSLDDKGGESAKTVRADMEGGDADGSGVPQDATQGMPQDAAQGMPQDAAQGGPRIVINPEVFHDKRDALCVAMNEAFRILMESMGFDPASEPTEKQRRFFSDTAYADDENMLRRTILARIATFDTSVSDPTDEQVDETCEFLHAVLESGAPQNQWEQQAVQRIVDVLEKGGANRRGGAEKPEDGGSDGRADQAAMGGGSGGIIEIGEKKKSYTEEDIKEAETFDEEFDRVQKGISYGGDPSPVPVSTSVKTEEDGSYYTPTNAKDDTGAPTYAHYSADGQYLGEKTWVMNGGKKPATTYEEIMEERKNAEAAGDQPPAPQDEQPPAPQEEPPKPAEEEWNPSKGFDHVVHGGRNGETDFGIRTMGDGTAERWERGIDGEWKKKDVLHGFSVAKETKDVDRGDMVDDVMRKQEGVVITEGKDGNPATAKLKDKDGTEATYTFDEKDKKWKTSDKKKEETGFTTFSWTGKSGNKLTSRFDKDKNYVAKPKPRKEPVKTGPSKGDVGNFTDRDFQHVVTGDDGSKYGLRKAADGTVQNYRFDSGTNSWTFQRSYSGAKMTTDGNGNKTFSWQGRDGKTWSRNFGKDGKILERNEEQQRMHTENRLKKAGAYFDGTWRDKSGVRIRGNYDTWLKNNANAKKNGWYYDVGGWRSRRGGKSW